RGSGWGGCCELFVDSVDEVPKLIGSYPEREPTIRIICHHFKGLVGGPTDPDRRSRQLDRLRKDDCTVEIDMAAMEARLLFGPARPHGFEGFACKADLLFAVGA